MEERKKAVAVKYSKDDTAPKVLAKGQGIVAENIIENAKEEDISVIEDKALVDELTKVEIGEYIPEELYEVVAKVLLFVSDIDKARDKYI